MLVGVVRRETGKLYTEKVNTWKWEVMLDLTSPKMVIANTVKFSCFYDERREWLLKV
jgi:hypothetical protein